MKKKLFALGVLFLAGCASTTPPKKPENMCEILFEKPDWRRALEATQEKWGAPPQIVLSIIYQESGFKHDAQPPMDYFLGIIPIGRKSSAYGYPQAKDDTWDDYKRQTNQSWVSRSNFTDASDFVGWYMHKSEQINGVSKWDARNQYLNYHEGWGGFSRRTYTNKAWLLRVASRVQERAERYGTQYAQCR